MPSTTKTSSAATSELLGHEVAQVLRHGGLDLEADHRCRGGAA